MNPQQLVRGHRIGGGSAYPFREYVYKGDQPHTPPPPAQWGAAFTSARVQGLIESAGYKKSTTKTRNNGSHQIWRRKTKGVEAA